MDWQGTGSINPVGGIEEEVDKLAVSVSVELTRKLTNQLSGIDKEVDKAHQPVRLTSK